MAMNGKEAFKAMIDGKKIYTKNRFEFDDDFRYLVFERDSFLVLDSSGREYDWERVDWEATDWEVYEEPKPRKLYAWKSYNGQICLYEDETAPGLSKVDWVRMPEFDIEYPEEKS